MTLTKKNHYIPCFWSAYWNLNYLNKKRENLEYIGNKPVRKTNIFSLNIKSNNIFPTTVENVFYQKKSGIAFISPEKINEYSLDNSSELYSKDLKHGLEWDFENHFSIMEESYKEHLEKLILSEEKIDVEYKTYLTSFIIFQILRHPKVAESMMKLLSCEKVDLFLSLKMKLSNPNEMIKLYQPIIIPKWIIYKLDKNIFPLSDNPIVGKKFKLMIPIAPNILIYINLKEKSVNIGECLIKNKINYFTYRQFLKGLIQNASQEIIFGDTQILKKIQKSRFYKSHLVKK